MFISQITIKNKKKYKMNNIDIFKKYIKGFVSYYRGAPPYVFPKSIIKIVKCKMSNFQYKFYKLAIKNFDFSNSSYSSKILTPFFLKPRFASNISYPNNKYNKSGFLSLTSKNISNIKKYSIKFHLIISKINSSKGPIFIYSNFKSFGGLLPLIFILESHGYKNYFNFGVGKKRFVVWSGDVSHSLKCELIHVFNDFSNSNGNLIKIILGSPSIKEGVSLLRVQQVHIIEPYWNYSRIEQIIGRAIRYCSHKDLPDNKKIVRVYIYLSVHSNESCTIDQYIYNMALSKKKIISQFEFALKRSSIDCHLFKNANVYNSDKLKYSCFP
jgi:hypothetical protein